MDSISVVPSPDDSPAGIVEAKEEAEVSRRDKNHGPVTNPLNVDWSAWQPAGMSREAVDLRIRKRIARSRMQRFRSVPVKRRIWWVTLTAIVVSEANFTSRELSSHLTFAPQAFWSLSRRKAKAIVARDQAAGGSGTLYPVEYRLCAVCSRVLLGPEAYEYRKKQMKPESTWHFPEGPACSYDCKPCGRGPGGQPKRYKRRNKTA